MKYGESLIKMVCFLSLRVRLPAGRIEDKSNALFHHAVACRQIEMTTRVRMSSLLTSIVPFSRRRGTRREISDLRMEDLKSRLQATPRVATCSVPARVSYITTHHIIISDTALPRRARLRPTGYPRSTSSPFHIVPHNPVNERR